MKKRTVLWILLALLIVGLLTACVLALMTPGIIKTIKSTPEKMRERNNTLNTRQHDREIGKRVLPGDSSHEKQQT